MTARRSAAGEIPIEQAPLWVLAIVALLLAVVAYPAFVGILDGLGAWHGEKLRTAVAAAVLGLGVVACLATRKPWKRPRGTEPATSVRGSCASRVGSEESSSTPTCCTGSSCSPARDRRPTIGRRCFSACCSRGFRGCWRGWIAGSAARRPRSEDAALEGGSVLQYDLEEDRR
jgi:hypothetical protein